MTKDWNEANTYCSQTWPGATLAMFPNENYQYFASSMLRNFGNDVWIGGLKTTSDNTFHWQDGSRITFSFWAEGEPNNWDGEEDKIQMSWYSDNQYATRDPGQWNDADGGIPMGFMCTHKLDSTIAEEPSVACPAGFVSAPQTKDFCYKIVTDANNGWNEAQSYCKDLEKTTKVPTNLVSIEDIYEDNFVASFFHSAETNFDSTLGGLNGMWIGLSAYKTKENNIRYSWTDQFPTAYTRWGLNQPNSADIKLEPDYSCVYIG